MFVLGAGLSLVVLVGVILFPFLFALLAAAAAAILLFPVHQRAAARAPGHPTAVAAAFVGLASLLAVVPLLLGGWTILREAAEAYPAARAWLEGFSAPGLDLRGIALENLNTLASWAGGLARTLVKESIFVLLNMGVFAAALFLFLRDGPRMIRGGAALIPWPEEDQERLLSRAGEALRAVVNGIFAVALLQGLLAWVGLALFRVPFAALLGALCALLSPIPVVGSALVWAPVVLDALLSGATSRAVVLTLWFALVVGVSDNILRPILIGSRMKMPVALLFISVVGAMKAFGWAGLFLGPLVVAVSFGLIDMLRERQRRG